VTEDQFTVRGNLVGASEVTVAESAPMPLSLSDTENPSLKYIDTLSGLFLAAQNHKSQ
jgi:hypothetical protein